ncbi:MAG: radical SAM protein [Bacteroidota bacterium]
MENITLFQKYLRKRTLRSVFSGTPSFRKINDAIQLYRTIADNEKNRKRQQTANQVGIPALCMFSVTWNCNLACKGCYAMNYKNKSTLTIEEIETTLRQMVNYGTYVFIIAGGEPLTVKGLIPALSRIQRGIFFLFTNGTLVNREIINQFKKNRKIIPVISIEGEDIHTADRRGERVSEKLKAVFGLLRSEKIVFGISTMATRLNVSSITSREYAASIRTLGASFLYLIDYIPFEFSLNTEYILTAKDHEMKRIELNKRKRENGLATFNFPSDEYIDGICEAAGKGFLHINANGMAEPCPFSHYAKDNILEKNYIQVLKSDFFREIRENVGNMNNTSGSCLLFENRKMLEEIAGRTEAYSTECM